METAIAQAANGALAQLGVAAIVVIAAYFLVRYFVSELASKDARLTDVTDRFIEATREQTAVIAKVTEEMRGVRSAQEDMAEAIRELKDAIRGRAA